jgi:beta-galactosidase beta subunit
MVSEGPARTRDSAKWEDHQQYIDIHHVIRGKENMGLAPVCVSRGDHTL